MMLRVQDGAAAEHGLDPWMEGLASFFSDRSMIAGIGGAWGASSFIDFRHLRTWQPVTCVTLSELFLTYEIQQLDAFIVDAEGYDARILNQLDLDRWRPVLIVIEVVSVKDEELEAVVARLCAQGYAVVTDHMDLLALEVEAQPSTTPHDVPQHHFAGNQKSVDPSLLPHNYVSKRSGEDRRRSICALSVTQHGADEVLVVRGLDGRMVRSDSLRLSGTRDSCSTTIPLCSTTGIITNSHRSCPPALISSSSSTTLAVTKGSDTKMHLSPGKTFSPVIKQFSTRKLSKRKLF
jgi:hypothetical protein